jgi:hypothetical protein
MRNLTTGRPAGLLLTLLATLTLLLPVAGLAPTASATVNPGSISGVVTDLADGPLAGITVSVLRDVLVDDILVTQVVASGTTSDLGEFQIGDIEAFPYYKVRFSDPTAHYATEFYDDQISGGKSVPVTGGSVTPDVDAQLSPAASISGRLTNGSGGPVTNGFVMAVLPGLFQVIGSDTTDSDGRYTLAGLPGASYTLEFFDFATDAMRLTSVTVSSGQVLTGVDATLGGQVTNTSPPTISGTAQVGQPLTAGPGTWQPTDATVSYRWVVGDDTSPADDSPGSVYVPTAADVGKTIRVHVTGTYTSELGWVPASAWSAPTAVVVSSPPAVVQPPPAIANIVRPRVMGDLRVGEVLRVKLGRWTPTPTSVKYQWYAKGKAVKGATHRRFTPTQKQLGKRLWVKVTAKAVGYTPTTVTTPRTGRIKD